MLYFKLDKLMDERNLSINKVSSKQRFQDQLLRQCTITSHGGSI